MSNIIIRVDGNKHIGLGHVMRCLSVADACVKVGHSVTFTIADNSVENIVKDRGYEVIVLHSDYDKMDDELPLWDVVDISEVDVFIVDSYYVTPKYLNGVRSKVNSVEGRLVYIDDVMAFAYTVDVVINYNAYAERPAYEELYDGDEVRLPEMILGPTYAPLREMFCGMPSKVQPKIVRDVLVSTGGSDELHLILELVRYICGVGEVQKQNYHILIGEMNADRDEIYRLASYCDNIIVHENVFDMKELITSVDIVVSAAGLTLYEVCACSVPLITYAMADNQLLGAEAFERLGLAVNVGDLRDSEIIDQTLVVSGEICEDAIERIVTVVEILSDDYNVRRDMGRRMQESIDGYGAERLVKRVTSII